MRVMTTSPLSTSLASSRCTAPVPADVRLMISRAKKLRSVCPKRRPRTLCCVRERSASANEVLRGSGRRPRATMRGRLRAAPEDVPILGSLVPVLGSFRFEPNQAIIDSYGDLLGQQLTSPQDT